jgi:alpha-beta hydrolase superfamily lysophospholipase
MDSVSIIKNAKEVTGVFSSSFDKEKIFYKNISVKNKKNKHKINLFIVHGASEYHAKYYHLAQYLSKNLNAEITFSFLDLKGHGLSGGLRCHINNFDEYCLDLTKLINITNKNSPSDLNYVFSHSMGGLISLKTLINFKKHLDINIDGLILSNPYIKDKAFIGKLVGRMSAVNNKTINRIRISNKFLNKDNLITDKKLQHSTKLDPLNNNFLTIGLIKEINKNSKIIRRLPYYLDIPTLFLLSENNVMVDTDSSMDFCENMDQSLTDSKLYQNMGHELICDENKEIVFNDIEKWINNLSKGTNSR